MRAAYALMTLGVCLLITALMMPSEASEGAKELQLASAHLAAQTAVERLQGGEIIDCPGCDLSGADLSHTCVKEKNLAGPCSHSASTFAPPAIKILSQDVSTFVSRVHTPQFCV